MGGMALGGHTGGKESYAACKQRRQAEQYQQDLEDLKQTQDPEKACTILKNNKYRPESEFFKTAFEIVIKNDPQTALYLIRKKIRFLEQELQNPNNQKQHHQPYLAGVIQSLRTLYEYEQQAMSAAGEQQISTKREEVGDRIKRLLGN